MSAISKLGPVGLLTLPVRLALTDARITAPLLFGLLYFPQRMQYRISPYLYRLLTSDSLHLALGAALLLALLRQANSAYSTHVVNNGTKNARFVKSQELVLITGGCSGIGESIARQFVQKGVKVVVLDINEPTIPLPSNVSFYQADVTSASKIAAVAAEIRRDHGDPTVLINNAGIGTGATILGGDEKMIQKTFEVNTISHFWMVREFLPAMIKKNHGHVVTIASMASYIVHAGNVDYACSKASALAFHEGLTAELKARYKAPNVKTTVVNPSWVRTPLTDTLLASPTFKDPVLEIDDVSSEVVKQVLLGQSGQLILPRRYNALSTLRAWPAWLQYGLRNSIATVLEAPGGSLLSGSQPGKVD